MLNGFLGIGQTRWSERMIYEFMHPDYREASLRLAEHVNAGGDVVHFENKVYYSQDGHASDIHWTTRWFGKKEQVELAFARDITGAKTT